MIKSVHRSRCSRLMSIKVLVVTAPNLQRALSMDTALGLPLPHPTRCLTQAVAPADLRPARLMSASLKFIAPGITADATSQPEFDCYLAAPAAEACDAMQWWEANAHRYRNTARLAKQYFVIVIETYVGSSL